MHSLRAKLLISLCLVEVLVVAVIVGVVTSELRRDTSDQKQFVAETMEQRAREGLRDHLRLLQALLEEDQWDCVRAVELVSQSPRAIEAIEGFDVKFLQRFLDTAAGTAELDLLALYDLDGNAVAAYPLDVDDIASGDFFQSWGLAQRVRSESGSPDTAGTWVGSMHLPPAFLDAHPLGEGVDRVGALGQVVLQVVFDDFGDAVAVALGVKVLNGHHFPFERAHRISDHGSALYAGPGAVAWGGFGDSHTADGRPPPIDPTFSGGDPVDGEFRDLVTEADGQPLLGTTLPLRDMEGIQIGHLLATVPVHRVQDAVAHLGESSDGMLRSVRSAVLVVGAVALILFLGLALLIESQLITRPLGPVVRGLADLVEGGADLTVTLPARSQDEVGRLAGNFNGFMARMREWVLRTRDTSTRIRDGVATIQCTSQAVHGGARDQTEHLEASHGAAVAIGEGAAAIEERTLSLVTATETSSSATQQMGATAQEIAAKMDELFRLVDQVSSSIHQMSSVGGQVSDSVETLAATAQQTAASVAEMDETIGQVRRGAERTGEVAEGAARDALSGKQAVDATVAGVESLSDMVEESTGVIRELSRRSGQIGGILTTISDVAEQTNLLALNASIIAAQAGRHGTGFGVVANEIKTLAASTKASAKEIAGIVGGFQEVAQRAVESAESGRSLALEELERAREAGSRLDCLLASSDESHRQAVEIARATKEQAESSRQITQAVDRVGEMLGQITTAVQEQVDGYSVLAEASDAMRDIASEVKIGTDEQAQGSGQIADNMEHVRSMLDEIDTATREQTRRSQDVLESVTSALEVARRNADLSAEFDAVVASLTSQAETLRREVDAFKT